MAESTSGQAVATQKEDSFANQSVRSTKVYGDPSKPSHVNMAGRYVSKIESFGGGGSPYYITGLQFTYDNGTVVSIGGVNNPSYGSLDLSHDTIAQVFYQTMANPGGNSNILSGLYIVTVRGEVLSHGNGTPYANPNSWSLMTPSDGDNPVSNIMVVGTASSSGTLVDALALLFKQDVMISHGMTNVDYSDLSAGTPEIGHLASATVSNRTAEEQQMSISFAEAVSTTYEFSTTAGVSAGLTTTVSAGVPFVANGEVEVSATVSLDVTIGVSRSVEKTFTYEAVITVAPGETVTASAQVSSSSISGNYTAKMSEVWVHAGAVTRDVAGSISGVSAYDVTVDYDTVS